MATNRELRAALLQKVGTKQNLSRYVQKKRSQLPMTTEEATYVIAHENGIKISDYLDTTEVAHVRALQAQLRHANGGGETHRKAPAPKAHPAVNGAREIRFPGEFKATNTLLSAAKLQEAKDMAAIFPLLYVLENSIRDLIVRVMYAKYGEDWWNSQLTSGKANEVRQKAAGRMSSQEKRYFWHQRRGAHPIDYVDLPDLGLIVQAKQADFFPGIIPEREWFLHLMRELEPSRNVVCHMNPLEKGNVDDVRSWSRKWEKTMKAAAERGVIPVSAPVPK